MEVILEKLEIEIEKYAKEFQLDLVDVEYVKEGGYNYLRVYIEKEDGNTTLDDCAEFSIKIDPIVDKLIDEKFFLEVSTPGIERRLKKAKDFMRFIGEEIKLYSKIQIEGKKTFEGKLIDFKEDENKIYMEDSNLGKNIEILLEKVKKANLIYRMPNSMSKGKEE